MVPTNISNQIHLFSGDDLISTKGKPHGFLLASKKPLAALAGPDEVNATKDYELPSFYPLAPTIDLTVTNIYKDNDFTGELSQLIWAYTASQMFDNTEMFTFCQRFWLLIENQAFSC